MKKIPSEILNMLFKILIPLIKTVILEKEEDPYKIISVSKNSCLLASDSSVRIVELILQFEDYQDVLKMDIKHKSSSNVDINPL